MTTDDMLLEVRGLKKHFPIRSGFLRRVTGTVKAVDGIDFHIKKGETLGLVGESGCGKSTAGRALLRLHEPTAGEIIFNDPTLGKVDVAKLDRATMLKLRPNMQIIFQDPFTSLNPRLTAGDSIAFGPRVHGMKRAEARALADDLLRRVGLDPALFAGRYPHELSGGQRQRVNIARALALSPRLLILDEAVSALDKSVEAQVLNLLGDLKAELGLTYVFISHDLDVVRFMSDRVMVMYLGKVVEIGDVEAIYADPRHPYTAALLSAMPSADPDRRTEEAPLAGDPPNPIDPPPGCRFHTRCPFAEEPCRRAEPGLNPAGDRRQVACHVNDPSSGHSRAGRQGEAA
jgi:peptide/nickel transport system ATP-binding protein